MGWEGSTGGLPSGAPPGVPPEGRAGDDWRGRLSDALRFARRQVTGEGEVNEFGFDPEFNSRLLIPLARLLYQQWFRVGDARARPCPRHRGGAGRGQPFRGAPARRDHAPDRAARRAPAAPEPAPARRGPGLRAPGPGDLARRAGHTPACPANADRLLRDGELVGVFPEGFKGIGKPFSDRYQLRRFGRGGFAATALPPGCRSCRARSSAPRRSSRWSATPGRRPAARAALLPLTPLFPWFGPLGAVPLPSKWIIGFGGPVDTPGAPTAPGSTRRRSRS